MVAAFFCALNVTGVNTRWNVTYYRGFFIKSCFYFILRWVSDEWGCVVLMFAMVGSSFTDLPPRQIIWYHELFNTDKIRLNRALFTIHLVIRHPENPVKPSDWGRMKNKPELRPVCQNTAEKHLSQRPPRAFVSRLVFLHSLCRLTWERLSEREYEGRFFWGPVFLRDMARNKGFFRGIS